MVELKMEPVTRIEGHAKITVQLDGVVHHRYHRFWVLYVVLLQ